MIIQIVTSLVAILIGCIIVKIIGIYLIKKYRNKL